MCATSGPLVLQPHFIDCVGNGRWETIVSIEKSNGITTGQQKSANLSKNLNIEELKKFYHQT
jgi:hypothetical protein